jgi:hypothetical protein
MLLSFPIGVRWLDNLARPVVREPKGETAEGGHSIDDLERADVPIGLGSPDCLGVARQFLFE